MFVKSGLNRTFTEDSGKIQTPKLWHQRSPHCMIIDKKSEASKYDISTLISITRKLKHKHLKKAFSISSDGKKLDYLFHKCMREFYLV